MKLPENFSDNITYSICVIVISSIIILIGYWLGKVPFFISLIIIVTWIGRQLANFIVKYYLSTSFELPAYISFIWGGLIAFIIRELIVYKEPNIILTIFAYGSGFYLSFINFEYIKTNEKENFISDVTFVVCSLLFRFII